MFIVGGTVDSSIVEGLISNGSTFLSDPRGSSQADKGNRGTLTRGEDTVIIMKGGILNRSKSLNECEMSSLSERVGKGREGRGKGKEEVV